MRSFSDAPSAAAWTAASLMDDRSWIVRIDESERNAIRAALDHMKGVRRDPTALGAADFPAGALAPKLEAIRREVEDGRGVVLLRGIPVEGLDVADCARIFCGLGMHLGAAMAQNPAGDLIGHVRDEGRDWKSDPTSRAYQTTGWLPFHSDPGDVVGLLCLRVARSGGLSSIASAAAIHNHLKSERPDLLEVLYGPFCYDSRGQEPPGEKPWHVLPVFEQGERGVTSFFVREYIESAQRFPEVPRLQPLQREAIETFEALSVDDRFRVDMEFQPGDIQLLNNHVVLHSRTAFEDFAEPERKRHLLRLWLNTPAYARHPPGYRQFVTRLEAWPRRQNAFS